MINFHRMARRRRRRRCRGQRRIAIVTRERILSKYSTSYSLVTVEANRHRIAESTK